MIAAGFLGLIVLAAHLDPATVLARYAQALLNDKPARVLSFEYTLEQSGVRTGDQHHRVFRSGANERDELLIVDGKTLIPPRVRVFNGRRNRYTLAAFAPTPAAYAFRFVGAHKVARHYDYDFETTVRTPSAFAITRITLDGAEYLPSLLTFVTATNEGSGTIAFARVIGHWVPVAVSARATVGRDPASERLTFSRYRFPQSLPPSTFAMPRPLPTTSAAP